MNVPERVKKALFEKGWSQKKLCAEIDVSENGFKRMTETNSWKVETLEKMSVALEVPITYFFDESEIKSDSLTSESNKSDDVYLRDYLHGLEDKFSKLIDQLNVKDHQLENQAIIIAGLQRTVDVLVGKSEGATLEPLSPEVEKFEKQLREYKDLMRNPFRRKTLHKFQSGAKSVARR